MDSWTLQHKVKQQLYVAVRNPINNPNSKIHSFSSLGDLIIIKNTKSSLCPTFNTNNSVKHIISLNLITTRN